MIALIAETAEVKPAVMDETPAWLRARSDAIHTRQPKKRHKEKRGNIMTSEKRITEIFIKKVKAAGAIKATELIVLVSEYIHENNLTISPLVILDYITKDKDIHTTEYMLKNIEYRVKDLFYYNTNKEKSNVSTL
jgi:hypothetical protein